MKKKKKKTIKLTEKVVFELAYLENAERIALALCRAGYFVNITKGIKSYEVLVYFYGNE